MARGMRRVPTYYQDLFDIIGANPGHLIGGTACLGSAIATQLLKYKENQNKDLWKRICSWITQMSSLFGKDNFYLELQPNKSKEQTYVNRQLLILAKQFNLPYIITCDSHYLKKEDAPIHEAFLNAQNGEREVKSFYATTYLMGTEELESYLELTEKELEEAYSNIRKIKDSCQDYSLKYPLVIPKLPWEDFNENIPLQKWVTRIPLLKDFLNSSYDGDKKLVYAIVNKLESDTRLQNEETYNDINECLKMTMISSAKNNAHWSAYFLNLQKIVKECWNAGSLVGCGRGSGVGFILLYILGITQINPLWEKTRTHKWRFLNPDRVSLLDVDVDIEGSKRKQVLTHLRKVYREDRVANVATFREEKSKSAILTAARGLGIDIDIAQYISGMITADRGILRTLDQTFYGDKENGIKPNQQFVQEMTTNYPELWEVAHKIEGLISGYGVHAGGVIFVDEPFTEKTSLMRAPDGTIITAFDLHDCEKCSLIKYDILSIEGLDRIHTCLDLLVKKEYIKPEKTLKETYEKVIGIYNLERDDPKMWEMVWNHEILSLFQMEKQSGIAGIALTHPKSVDELATLNSVIRLMAQEKGAEQPLSKFARFKNDINLWYQEMDRYGLTKDEQKLLEPIVKISYGICESQEKFMELVQMPECGGFDLTWADGLRKAIAKKNPAAYEKLQKEYFETIKSKGLSWNLCNYVWNVLVATSKGYGFNQSHTLAYSLVALQEMNLAFHYPIVFWNCACLICESGGDEPEDVESSEEELDDTPLTYSNEMEEFSESDNEADIVDSYEEEDCDGAPVEVVVMKNGKKKKKVKTTNFGRIATAIGKMAASGISVSPPDINDSDFTFTPDVEHNLIRYGLRGIAKIGEDLVKTIMANRPYTSLEDFQSKVKTSKPQLINLLKSGAFDAFGDRVEMMKNFIDSAADKKQTINLRNLQMLISENLIPEKFEEQVRYFNFNKYLKKLKWEKYYALDNIAFKAFERYAPMDILIESDKSESGFLVLQTDWDKIWKKQQDILRPWVKEHSEELRDEVNQRAFNDLWKKYADGTVSKWEMDSVSYYSHPHELAKVNQAIYGFADYFKLPESPTIENVLKIKGKDVPIFKIERICGTILDKDKNKKTLSLLTTTGVVTVRIFGDVFTHYDRQISRKNPDGTKTVLQKSWFARGNKIIICGIRREDSFQLKKYSRTPWHSVELITKVNDDGTIETCGERLEV